MERSWPLEWSGASGEAGLWNGLVLLVCFGLLRASLASHSFSLFMVRKDAGWKACQYPQVERSWSLENGLHFGLVPGLVLFPNLGVHVLFCLVEGGNGCPN